MDEQDQKETKKVATIKENKDDKNPRRIIRFILIIVLSLILLLNLIFGIIYFVKNYQKKSQQSTSDSSYVVDEEIPTIYNHMLSYINIERDDLSLDDAKNIVSMQYKDKEVYLTLRCEEHPSFRFAVLQWKYLYSFPFFLAFRITMLCPQEPHFTYPDNG